MKREFFALSLLLALSACGEPDPMARTDDLWPGFRRAAGNDEPTAADIEQACAEAAVHFKVEAEKTPGTYVDPTYFDYPVRSPACGAEPGSAATLLCRFEQTEVGPEFPTAEQRNDQLARAKESDWTPYRARLVRVRGQSDSRWIAPAGCEPLPKPAL